MNKIDPLIPDGSNSTFVDRNSLRWISFNFFLFFICAIELITHHQRTKGIHPLSDYILLVYPDAANDLSL
jgi:hypothetical protein